MKANEESQKLHNLGFRIESKLIRDHQWESNRMADWQCNIIGPNGCAVSIEYHTGKGHRVMRGSGKSLSFRPCLADWKLSKATDPNLADVISSLLLDSSAADETFADWCSDYGYDTDSRKALDIYLTCQESAVQLRTMGANTDEVREILENY